MEIRLTREHLKGSDLYYRWEDIKNIYIEHEGISAIVKNHICIYFNVEFLSSKSRESKYVRARQIYCAVMKAITKKSYSEIGAEINRDHSSVIAALKKFRAHYKFEKDYREDTQAISTKLNIENQEKIYKYLKSIK